MKGVKKTAIIMLVLSCISYSQNLRERLFGEVNSTLSQAQGLSGSLLSPEFYEKGMKLYHDAEKDLEKGKEYEIIEEKLKKADKYFQKAFESARIAVFRLKNSLNARKDALNAGAQTNAQELWQDAEELLDKAARDIEKNDMEDVDNMAFEAENIYRKAELAAIKSSFLNKTKEILDTAKDKDAGEYAPATYNKSVELVEKTEELLDQNRYNNGKALELAGLAYYEAQHALYITDMANKINNEELSLEELILSYEKPLLSISGALGFTANVSKGTQKAEGDILENVNELLKRKYESLQDMAKLRAEANAYREKLTDVNSERGELEKKLTEIKEYEADVNEVKNLFGLNEAKVIVEEDYIIIRLTGLNFLSGSSVINPSYFFILSKLKQAILKFPGSAIKIEGHTDSFGEENENMKLSRERAQAVYQYLAANMSLDSYKIFAIGYGETKPVANNETEEGRIKNRRIDVVIKPGSKNIKLTVGE